MAQQFKARHSRLLQILELSRTEELPPPYPLSQVEVRKVAHALAHVSYELRSRVAEEVAAGQLKAPFVSQMLVKLLESQGVLKVYQSRVALLDSLASIGLGRSLAELLPEARSALCKALAESLTREDEGEVQAAARCVGVLGVHTDVARLLVQATDRHALKGLGRSAATALALLGDVPESAALALMSHVDAGISPGGWLCGGAAGEHWPFFVALCTGLEGCSEAAYGDGALRALLAAIRKAHTARHFRVASDLLRLLAAKYARRILEFQLASEEAAPEARPGPNEAYAGCLEAVQTMLECPAPALRTQAVEFVRRLAPSRVFPGVIAHQIILWLHGPDAAMRRVALFDSLQWLLPGSSLASRILSLLAPEDEARVAGLGGAQVEEMAIAALHPELLQVVCSDTHTQHIKAALETYTEGVLADLILSSGRSPALAWFTRGTETPRVRAVAFDLLRQTPRFSHEALNNAAGAIAIAPRPGADPGDLALAATRFVCAAAILADYQFRAPAVSILADVLEEADSERQCDVLRAIAEMLGDQRAFGGVSLLSKLVPLLFAGSDSVVALARSILRDRMAEAAVASMVCSRLASRLLNATSLADKLTTLEAVGHLGCADHSLAVGLLVALLDNESPEMRLGVLEALSRSTTHAPEAEAKASRLLSSSQKAVQRAAASYLFRASAPSLQSCQPPLLADVFSAASACLLGPGPADPGLRALALGFLDRVASAQVAGGSGVVVDRLSMKETVVRYLKHNAKSDPKQLQAAAWEFHSRCFTFDQSDMKLLVDAFVTSQDGAGGGFQSATVAEAFRNITLGSKDEVDFALQVALKDRPLPFLLFEPVLRYAQQSGREVPKRWARQLKALKSEAPVVATLLAAEFVAPSKPRFQRVWRAAMPLPAAPAAGRQRDYVREGDDIYAVPSRRRQHRRPAPPPTAARAAAIRGSGGGYDEDDYALPDDVVNRPAAQPRISAPKPARGPAPIPSPHASERQYTQQGAIAIKTLSEELAASQAAVQRLQKAIRDEKRLRLLLEERCRSLGDRAQRRSVQRPKGHHHRHGHGQGARGGPRRAQGANKFAALTGKAHRATGARERVRDRVRAHDSDVESSSDEEGHGTAEKGPEAAVAAEPATPAADEEAASMHREFRHHAKSIRKKWGATLKKGLAHAMESASSSSEEEVSHYASIDASSQADNLHGVKKIYEELEKLDAESEEDPLYAAVGDGTTTRRQLPSKPVRARPLLKSAAPRAMSPAQLEGIVTRESDCRAVLRILVEELGPHLRHQSAQTADPQAAVSIAEVWVSLLQVMFFAADGLVGRLDRLRTRLQAGDGGGVSVKDVAHAYGDCRAFLHVYPRAQALAPLLVKRVGAFDPASCASCVERAKALLRRERPSAQSPGEGYGDWLSSPLAWLDATRGELEGLQRQSASDGAKLAVAGALAMVKELLVAADDGCDAGMLTGMAALHAKHGAVLGAAPNPSRHLVASFEFCEVVSRSQALQDGVPSANQPREKVGPTRKVHLVSDGVLIGAPPARFRASAASVFAPVEAIEVLEVNEGLNFFGLRYTPLQGEAACQVFRSQRPEEMHRFLKLLKRERALRAVVATVIEV